MGTKKNKMRKAGIVAAVAAVIVITVILVIFLQSRREEAPADEKKNELVTADGELFDYQETKTVKVGKYKGVEVVVEPDEEEVEMELSSVLDKFEVHPSDRTVRKGDYAYIDYKGTLHGITAEGLQSEDEVIHVGEYNYAPAFENALVGKEVGKTYTVPVTFADDYPDSMVAGQEVIFEISVKAKFDDFYAKKLSKGKYKNVKAFLQSLAKKLRKENMENLPELAWEAFVEHCEVNQYPKKLVNEEVDNLTMQYKSFAEISGTTYEELMNDLMMDDETVRETARDTVRDRMVAKTIAKWENMTVDDDTARKYMIQLMEYDEDDDETLEHLYENYREDYGSRPKDDILVAAVKELVKENAVVQ